MVTVLWLSALLVPGFKESLRIILLRFAEDQDTVSACGKCLNTKVL